MRAINTAHKLPGSGFVKVNQTVTGSAASDTFTSGAGDDAFDGGSGVDAVVYSIARSNATLKVVTGGFSLTDKSGALGTDTLTSIERLKFTDGSIALDLAALVAGFHGTQHAATVGNGRELGQHRLFDQLGQLFDDESALVATFKLHFCRPTRPT